MHSSLIAVVLCILAQASAACVPGTEAGQQAAAPIGIHASGATLTGAEAITTAAAGTLDAPVPRPSPRANAQPAEEHPRRAGPAMLLAALALMAGIALRRYGAGSP